MHDLLQSWRQVSPRLRAAEAIALFLDFDGTLAGFKARPEEVWLDPATRRALLRLTQINRMRICIITGRRLSDIRNRIRLPHLRYLGLHGWENSTTKELSQPTQAFLRQAICLLTRRIEGTAGLWIENKGATFALHFRGAADSAVAEARSALWNVLDLFAGRFRVMAGECVLEVLPSELAGKGVAARSEWLGLRRSLPVYVGNDATDEPAFTALSTGITVRVGRTRNTHARFHLRDPTAVRTFLQRLGTELG
jgi:trehalose 6-phosphate phosphatase